MVHMHPLPRIIEFNDFLSALVRIKHYGTVLYLSKQIELLQIERDAYHFSILINCFCRLQRVDFGFSVFGFSLKGSYLNFVLVLSILISYYSKMRGNVCFLFFIVFLFIFIF